MGTLFLSGIALVLIPVAAWYLLPRLHRAVGRPLADPAYFTTVPPLRQFGKRYVWMMRPWVVVMLGWVMFFAWIGTLILFVSALR